MSEGSSGQGLLEFETHLRQALFEGAGRLEVSVSIEIPEDLHSLVRRDVDQLQQGNAHPAEALQAVLQQAVSEYEDELTQYLRSRLEGSKVEVLAQALTELERTALESFLMWSVLQRFRSERDGQRAELLEQAWKAMYPPDDAAH